MKIDAQLDYQKILAGKDQPVNLVIKFTAAKREDQRKTDMAFCMVLDGSGSMDGLPIEKAREATKLVVRNLKSDDYFGLVVFESQAQTVIPLQKITNRQKAYDLIDGISADGGTNLAGGWMLGRDELKKSPAGIPRRVLILSDGQTNVGIQEPDEIKPIVAMGLEKDGIRTSCLGLGPDYNEDLMSMISVATGGNFHNANSAESLTAIFTKELEGLQEISAQNLRVRVQKLDFCDEFQPLTAFPSSMLPDQRAEYSLGDLVSEEEKALVLQLDVLALPLLPDNTPVASLEGEPLVKLEILYDEFGEKGIASIQQEQTVRVLATQEPGEVKINEAVVPWVALQKAGKALEKATQAVDQNDTETARNALQVVMEELAAYGTEGKAAEGIKILQQFMDRLERKEWDRKTVRHTTTSISQTCRIELAPGMAKNISGFKKISHPKKTTASASGMGLA